VQNARLDESKTGIKIARININNLRYADDTTLMTESKEELESLLLNIKKKKKKKKIVTSSPIISWEIDGETIQTVKDFFFF